jgi:hypothetical protein
MKTDDLIKAIAEDGAASARPMSLRVLAALGIGGLLAAALFAQALGVRPDIGSAMQTWRFAGKVVIALSCIAIALWATGQLSRPDAEPRAALAAFSLPMLLLGLAIGVELASSSAGTWSARAMGSNSRLCLVSITVLSVAPLAALLVALRAGAPRSPAMAGAAAGLLAGGLAAVLYAIHCPDDSPLFVALWYVPAVALVVLAGAAAGSRALRW